MTNPLIEGAQKASRLVLKVVSKEPSKIPRIPRYPKPKEWQPPEVPDIIINLVQDEVDTFNPTGFVEPPKPTLSYLGYIFAIRLVIFLAGYYYPTVAKAISNRVSRLKVRISNGVSQLKVRNWRQSVINGRLSTKVLPLADFSLRACASHPEMLNYTRKRCSKPEFRIFFDSFSSVYSQEYASREIVKIYIFCASYYSQHDMVTNGIKILKRRKISSNELFRVWRDLRVLLAVCQPSFLPTENGWAEWWNRFYIRRFPEPFSTPELIRVRQDMSQDLKNQLIDVEKHHNKLTTWEWYCDHSITTDLMLKILWFFDTDEAQMNRVPPLMRTSNCNMPLLTKKQWQQHRVYEFLYYMRSEPVCFPHKDRKGRVHVNSMVHRWLVERHYIDEPLTFRPPGKIWKVSFPRPINWLECLKTKINKRRKI